MRGEGTAAAAPADPPAEVSAPAKLTVTLRITGVRPDGYHLLESEMVTLDLADTLFISDGDHLAVSMEPVVADSLWDVGKVSVGPDNLVARALAAVGRRAEVHVVKRVPPGAGLGGGSADAAAILRWAGCTDLEVAGRLGADVPFCVRGGRAMVRGIGELVAPLPDREQRFTLLLLPFGVDTGAVYRAWDELTDRGGSLPGAVGSNDLEAAALVVEPRLDPWRRLLEGQTGGRAHLAGSGSTWFVEGWPEGLSRGERRLLTLGDEHGALVAVTTTPSAGG
jgi:4-diphosphocytidyl-2-C-methyl-D-erythritol kinase